MGHLDAKSGNFRSLNPLNPSYQGDFKRECVSPKVKDTGLMEKGASGIKNFIAALRDWCEVVMDVC